MKRSIRLIAVSALGAAAAGPVFAEVVAYPKEGQSADQQDGDKYSCFKWAKQPESACLDGRGYSTS